jgi:hypothetical protein
MTPPRTKKDIRPMVFFKGYDYGDGSPSASSPGGGLWMNQHKYKSVGEFVKKRRKERKRIMENEKNAIIQHHNMSLMRTAQSLDGVDVFPENLKELQNHHEKKDVLHLLAPKDDNIIMTDDLKDEGGVIEIDLDDERPTFSYKLERMPGSKESDDFDIAEEIEVEEPEEVEVNQDPWSWKMEEFHEWLNKMLHSFPPHDGKGLAGVLRALSHGDRLIKEILSASKSDFHNQLDMPSLEEALDELHKGQQRLTDRKEKLERVKYNSKKKKKADAEDEGLVKQAKIAGIKGIVVSVPLLISSLARSCINSMVSGGKDIERTYETLHKEYSLSKRERLELLQCLADMGYGVRRDLGAPLDDEIDTRSEDNINWTPNYPG